LHLHLPMVAGQKVDVYTDDQNKQPRMEQVTLSGEGDLSVTLQPGGGFVLVK